jgi:hypothetical protein
MNWQVFDAVGIALGSTANIVASTQGETNPDYTTMDWG